MGELGTEGIAAGGAVVEILLSGELEAWIDTFGLAVTTVRPKDDATQETLGGRENAHIIDLQSGVMVWHAFGSFSGSGDSVIVEAIDELLRRLAEQ